MQRCLSSFHLWCRSSTSSSMIHKILIFLLYYIVHATHHIFMQLIKSICKLIYSNRSWTWTHILTLAFVSLEEDEPHPWPWWSCLPHFHDFFSVCPSLLGSFFLISSKGFLFLTGNLSKNSYDVFRINLGRDCYIYFLLDIVVGSFSNEVSKKSVWCILIPHPIEVTICSQAKKKWSHRFSKLI